MSQEEFIKGMVDVWGMSQVEREIAIKKARIFDLWMDVMDFPPMLRQFFDLDSDKLLDEKIEALTTLKEGKPIHEIPKFYDILELYPKDQEQSGIVTNTFFFFLYCHLVYKKAIMITLLNTLFFGKNLILY